MLSRKRNSTDGAGTKRPIVRIVATDGKSYPLVGSSAPFGEPATIGAARGLPCQSAEPQTGSAAAPIAPTFTCRECSGEGEAQYLALDETEYRWRACHVCEGSRVEAPYCDICQGSLTCDLYCVDCDEWASLTFVERISPTRVAL